MVPRAKTSSGPDVLLVNPWIYDFAAYDLWAKPLGLLYIAAVLGDHGYQVHLVDCLDSSAVVPPSKRKVKPYGQSKFSKELVARPAAYRQVRRRYGRYGISEDRFLKSLADIPSPAAILVTSGMTYWYPGLFQAIELLRGRFQRTPILLGGIYATLCTDHARRHAGADQVIPGPGESAALRAVDDICGRRGDADRYHHLDRIPFPAFDLYRTRDYACLLTSRGCPRRCSYCASHLLTGGYRRRNPAGVLAELEWLRLGLRTKNIAFYDDALLVDADVHLKPILEGVLRRRLDCWFHTPNGLHAGLIDRELAELMFRAGFKTIRLSLETADEDRQRRLGFKATREDLIRSLDLLSQAGFNRADIGVYLLAGLPEQDAEEIAASVQFVSGLGACAHLALYSPIPGTAEWPRALKNSREDLAAEPLWHNNTVFASTCPQLTPQKLEAIKLQAKVLNASLVSSRRSAHGVSEREKPKSL
jgi:radical SAM superfamily enzyme YgiQ (UPF0313 family)